MANTARPSRTLARIRSLKSHEKKGEEGEGENDVRLLRLLLPNAVLRVGLHQIRRH